jgi:7,8-dihydropterin-6-yl-methyl-4-(beta-D-ribofuranosyl)aminobenzene 5'-phosphate synthase
LLLSTTHGSVLLTGCAHPGIVKIVEKARLLQDERIALLLGGFHLEWSTKWKLEKIAAAFRRHGIRYLAPTHCSSDKARELFRQEYGPCFIETGVGRTITLADLNLSVDTH